MPLLRVPHSSSAPSLTISMAGGLCVHAPPPKSPPFGSAATRSAPSGGGCHGSILHARPRPSSPRSTRRDHGGQARRKRHRPPCEARGVGRSRGGHGYWCGPPRRDRTRRGAAPGLCSAHGRFGNENPHGVVEAASGQDTKARHRATIGSQRCWTRPEEADAPSNEFMCERRKKSLEVVLTAAVLAGTMTDQGGSPCRDTSLCAKSARSRSSSS